MRQKTKDTSHGMALQLAAAVFTMQSLAPVSASAQSVPVHHYTIISGMPSSNSGLARTPEQLQRMAVPVYVTAIPTFTVHKPQTGLFGSQETESDDTAPVGQYAGALRNADPNMGASSRDAVDMQYDIQRLKNKPREEQISGVNALLNKVPYVSDKKNYGKEDYWATPAEFMAHGGDCEDYAIAKYASLRALGVPEDQMRLTIVTGKNMPKDEAHAILVVHGDKGDEVLDDGGKVKNASDVKEYTPLMSINSKNWWQYSAPAKKSP